MWVKNEQITWSFTLAFFNHFHFIYFITFRYVHGSFARSRKTIRAVLQLGSFDDYICFIILFGSVLWLNTRGFKTVPCLLLTLVPSCTGEVELFHFKFFRVSNQCVHRMINWAIRHFKSLPFDGSTRWAPIIFWQTTKRTETQMPLQSGRKLSGLEASGRNEL